MGYSDATLNLQCSKWIWQPATTRWKTVLNIFKSELTPWKSTRQQILSRWPAEMETAKALRQIVLTFEGMQVYNPSRNVMHVWPVFEA